MAGRSESGVASQGSMLDLCFQTLELVKRVLTRLLFEVRGLQPQYTEFLNGFVLVNDLKRLDEVQSRWSDRQDAAFTAARRTVFLLSGDIKVRIHILYTC